jgi:hypothetical protein
MANTETAPHSLPSDGPANAGYQPANATTPQYPVAEVKVRDDNTTTHS